MKLKVYNPPIVSYLHHANMLSIVDLENESSMLEPWFAHNYIHLQCQPGLDVDRDAQLDFCHESFATFYEELFDLHLINRNIAENYNGGVLSFIIDQLNRGEYTDIVVNEYYLPCSIYFGNIHMDTYLFIYGYDTEAESLSVRFYSTHSYNNCDVSFGDFLRAFEGVQNQYSWSQTIRIYMKKQLAEFPSFNIRRFNFFLREYLHSRNSLMGGPNVYGISVYDSVIEYYNTLSRGETSVDYIPISVLHEHKKCFSRRLRFMSNRLHLDIPQQWIDSMAVLEKRCLKVKNMTIRYSMNPNNAFLDAVIEELRTIRSEEQQLLTDILDKFSDMELKTTSSPA